MLQNLRNYFAPEARARRARQQERKALNAELLGITAQRIYGYSREQAIFKRLRELDKADAPKQDERRAPRLHLAEDDFSLAPSVASLLAKPSAAPCVPVECEGVRA